MTMTRTVAVAVCVCVAWWAGVTSGEEVVEEVKEAEEVDTPSLLVDVVPGKGFNISIPDAGQKMIEFKYYVNFNQELKDVTAELFCKGRVECFSEKSKFRMERAKELKEGDTLHFYLVGFRKPDDFQMERVYEVKKNDEGSLEFQERSARAGLQKDGLWYQLDKMKETNN